MEKVTHYAYPAGFLIGFLIPSHGDLRQTYLACRAKCVCVTHEECFIHAPNELMLKRKGDSHARVWNSLFGSDDRS